MVRTKSHDWRKKYIVLILYQFIKYLRKIVNVHGNINILLILADLIAEYEDKDLAINFIFQELRNRATVQGIDKLIEYTLSKSEGETHEHLSTIKKLTTKSGAI